MPGRSSSEREALARQNAAIMAVFERAGFEHIAPDIIQPAKTSVHGHLCSMTRTAMSCASGLTSPFQPAAIT
jgi:hypothetical protein